MSASQSDLLEIRSKRIQFYTAPKFRIIIKTPFIYSYRIGGKNIITVIEARSTQRFLQNVEATPASPLRVAGKSHPETIVRRLVLLVIDIQRLDLPQCDEH